jgi:hypothetical protein
MEIVQLLGIAIYVPLAGQLSKMLLYDNPKAHILQAPNMGLVVTLLTGLAIKHML